MVACSRPPPYPFAPDLCTPVVFPPSPQGDYLLQAPSPLSKQVSDLKEVLNLQKQFADLSTELSSLQETVRQTVFPCPLMAPVPFPAISGGHQAGRMASLLHSHPNKASQKSHSNKTSQRVSSKKSLAFPVLTRQSRKEASSSEEDLAADTENGEKSK